MTVGRLNRSVNRRYSKRRQSKTHVEQRCRRVRAVEVLEDRRLLAGGPILVGVQSGDGNLFQRDAVTTLHIAPSTLKLRFDGNQRFTTNESLLNQAIHLTRAGNDGIFGTGDDVRVTPAFIGPNAAPNENEILLRFAQSLPDDLYRLEIFARDNVPLGIRALRNLNGDPLVPSDPSRDREVVVFELDLGAQVIAVVPQPIFRDANNRLTQQDNVILVYFNNDDLWDVPISTVPGGPNPTVVDPRFYQLIAVRDTLTNVDDATFYPVSVDYDPRTDVARLTFAQPLYLLTGDPNRATTFRLRIGTDEPAPAPPALLDFRGPGNPKTQFNIDLRYPDDSIPNDIQQVIRRAADRIEQIVVGDLPDEGTIDDLQITVIAAPLDGVGGFIATGFPTNLRVDSRLPFQAQITIDVDDLLDQFLHQQDQEELARLGAVASIDVLEDGSAYRDGQIITITDGSGRTERYEFDSNGTITPGNVRVSFTPGPPATTRTAMASALRSLIAATQSTLNPTLSPDGTRVLLSPADGVVRIQISQGARGIKNRPFYDVATLQESIEREILHAMGFGHLWPQMNLVSGIGTNNPRFLGPKALAEFNAHFNVAQSSIPLENLPDRQGVPFILGQHWREENFEPQNFTPANNTLPRTRGELMTGYLNYFEPNLISRITVAALADMGYVVDMDAADEYRGVYLQLSNTPTFTDGASITIEDSRGVVRKFEFVDTVLNNGQLDPGAIPLPFDATTTATQMANIIANAVTDPTGRFDVVATVRSSPSGPRVHFFRDRNIALSTSPPVTGMTRVLANIDPPLPYQAPVRPVPRNDAGSSFSTALDISVHLPTGTSATSSLVISSSIDPQFYGIQAAVIRVEGNGNALTDGSSFVIRYVDDDSVSVRSAKFEFEDLTLGGGLADPTAISVPYRSGPDGTVSTPEEIAQAIASAINATPAGVLAVEARAAGTTVFLTRRSTDLAAPTLVTTKYLPSADNVIFSANATAVRTDVLRAEIQLPGAKDEPGHRDIEVEEHIRGNVTDASDAITTKYYNFKSFYGFDANGNRLANVITENQKQRAREVLELYGRYLGVQFVETADQGLTIATGDPRAVRTFVPTGPGEPLGMSGGGVVVIDNAERWTDEFGGSWFREAMRQIGRWLGLGNAFDLPNSVMGNPAGPNLGFSVSTQPEPVFPGHADIIHGRVLYRPQQSDVDLYRFELQQSGLLTIETFAQRLPNSSLLDTLIKLYKVRTDARGLPVLDVRGEPVVDLIARNDNYFGTDSYLELELGPGIYYVGVSSAGNEDYDARTENSGTGGFTEGDYDLRLVFRPQAVSGITDFTRTRFDGDADGVPGGVYNFWFRTAPPLTAPFDPSKAAVIYVDKANQPPVGAPPPDGRLTNPFNTIPAALNFINTQRATASGKDTEYIIRIVGNGGDDKDITTLNDNIAYEIGLRPPFGVPLADGSKFDVPRNVTVMIDAGAIFKMRESSINVGSESPTVDRSGGAVQVLGAPFMFDRLGNVIRTRSGQIAPGSVYFTSWNDETIGADTNPAAPQTPQAGDWGGIIFRGDHDQIEARKSYERLGIFLDYVNHADMRYGGGKIVVNSVQQTITPIHTIVSRPTVTFNQITFSASGAISADPDSFKFSNFHDPVSQFIGSPSRERSRAAFTLDYNRIGPEIHGNFIVNNSTNGLTIRVQTLANQDVKPQTVTARWNDTDIVHVLTENLLIQGNPGGPVLTQSAPPVNLVRFVNPPSGTTGTLVPGTTYRYRITFVDRNGNEGPPSLATPALTDNPNIVTVGPSGAVQINNLPTATGDFVGRRLYRSAPGGGGPFVLVALLNSTDTTYIDRGGELGGILDTTVSAVEGVRRARMPAGLIIDPGTVVKLEGSRIQVGIGATLIAEGQDGREIVFTARQDDRFGGSGTFDTNSDDRLGPNEAQPRPGSWGGIYFGPNSIGSIDHALITYGGGITKGGGSFFATNAVEIHQAREVRVTNSVIERNEIGQGGQAGGPTSSRFGLGFNAPAAIFVRGSQPIIVNNIIRDNLDQNNVDFDPAVTVPVAAINVGVNSLDATAVRDHGRSTGFANAFTAFRNNYGVLVRENRLSNNGINGMVVRGGLVTTESVWDDADIVHVVLDEIVVPNFHTFGGLRLQSSATQSLVVKLFGSNAGFTATGTPGDVDDRIGGVLHIVGQPGFPVILTSLRDDTVGAGFDPFGEPQVDTNNDGSATRPAPGNWRSIKIDQYAHDRNVDVVLELESPDAAAPGPNAVPATAQFLGDLAPHEKAGDDNRRLGFVVYGYLSDVNDLDVYSFTADPGTEVWLDIDRTFAGLDTVVELLDATGRIIAQSDNSLAERLGVASIFEDNPPGADVVQANILQKSLFQQRDLYGTNPRDAGMRVVLPGDPNPVAPPTYFVRVRSSNLRPRDPISDLQDANKLLYGLSEGVYQLQVRVRELDEIPGSTVRFADIRYATNGVELIGQPTHSPLIGEAVEILLAGQTNDDNNALNASQFVGNLLRSERAVISVAGTLGIPARPGFGGISGFTDVDWYRFDLNYQNVQSVFGAVNPTADPLNNPIRHIPVVFDIDYADGFSRANTVISIFNQQGRLIYFGQASNIADDQPQPLKGANVDDLSRGSNGTLDAFVGPVELAVGPAGATYYVAVSSIARIPTVMDQFFTANATDPFTRFEPLPSVRRIVEDHIDGGVQPQTVILENLDNTGPNVQQYLAPQLSTVQNANRIDLPGGSNITSSADITGGFLQPVPFDLGNIVLFVSEQGPGAPSARAGRIKMINPFTGHEENIVGVFGENIGDISLVPGTVNLAGFSVQQSPARARRDDTTGIFTVLDTSFDPAAGQSMIVGQQDDGLLTYEYDPASTSSPFGPRRKFSTDGSQNGLGYEFYAQAFGGGALFAIGSIQRRTAPGGPHVPFNETLNDFSYNVLYRFNTNGVAQGTTKASGTEHFGAGTQLLNVGVVKTFTTLFVQDPTAGGTLTFNRWDPWAPSLFGGRGAIQTITTLNISGAPSIGALAANINALINAPGSPLQGMYRAVAGTRKVPGVVPPSQTIDVIELLFIGPGDGFGFDDPLARARGFFPVDAGGGFQMEPNPGFGPGGTITGMAFIGSDLFAVSDQGGLWQVTYSGENGGTQPRNVGRFVANIFDTVTDPANPQRVPFEGLSTAPQEVENARYSGMLFGMSHDGRLVAFKAYPTLLGTEVPGQLEPVFFQQQKVMHTITYGTVTGIAFSSLQANPWGATLARATDPGHGVNASPDGSRLPAPGAFSLGFNNYNHPGGAYGTLISVPFSLEGYSAADKPTLYFNYFLQTENRDYAGPFLAPQRYFTDSFRVFISDDDGRWELLGTNNQFGNNTTPDGIEDEFDFGERSNTYRTVQELYDNTGTWRQARIPLDKYAGRKNLRIRFDFSTAGDMNVGDPLTMGDELRALDGTTLRDGQSFGLDDYNEFESITNVANRFEADLGYTLVMPSGAKIIDGATFVVDGVTFEFDDDDLDGKRGNNFGDGVATGNVMIPFHKDMTPEEVAIQTQIAVEAFYNPRTFTKTTVDDFSRPVGGIKTITVTGNGNTFVAGRTLTIVNPLGNTWTFTFRNSATNDAGFLDFVPDPGATTSLQMAQEIANEINAANIPTLTGQPVRAVVDPRGTPRVLLPNDFSVVLGTPAPVGVTATDSRYNSNDSIPKAVETGIFNGAATYTVLGRIGDNPNLSDNSVIVQRDPGRDVDVYRIQVAEGSRIDVTVDTNVSSGARNAVVAIFDETGAIVKRQHPFGLPVLGMSYATTDFAGGRRTATLSLLPPIPPVANANPPQHNDPPVPREFTSDPGYILPAGIYYVVVSGGVDETNPVATPGNVPRQLPAPPPGYSLASLGYDPWEELSGPKGTTGNYRLTITVSNPDAPPALRGPVSADDHIHGDDRLPIDFGYTFINTHRDGNRINIPGAVSVTSTYFVGAPNTPFARVIEGAPGVFAGDDSSSPTVQPNFRIRVHSGMSRYQVATQIRQALADAYNGGDMRLVKQKFDYIRLVGHQVNSNNLGPLADNLDAPAFQKFGVAGRLNNAWLPGDSTFNPLTGIGDNNPAPGSGTGFGYYEASTLPNGATNRAFPGALRNQRNNFEGVYVDDIIIGFAERGEMVTGTDTAAQNLPNSGMMLNPQLPDGQIFDGPYQLEIRRGADFGLSVFPPHDPNTIYPTLALYRTFDTNDRLTPSTSLVIPPGWQLREGQTFRLSDGVNTVTFEYDDLDLGNGVAPGHVQVGFRDFEPAHVVAARVRDAINSAQVQAVLKVTAALSDGTVTGPNSTSNVVNLFGNVVGGLPANSGPQDYSPYDFGDVTSRIFGVVQQRRILDGREVLQTVDPSWIGDSNVFRDQGQILVHSNIIRDAQNFAIRVDAGVRESIFNFPGGNTNNNPHPGPVRNFSELNLQRWVPGVTLTNNLMFGNGQGGISISGDPLTGQLQLAPIPFARVVNNTLYGQGPFQNDVGIRVTTNVSPTLLNNIVANFTTGIFVDSSSASTVISGTLYKDNVVPANTPVGLGDFAINLDLPSEPNKSLFVDPSFNVFYLAAGSRAIDSSVASVNDRTDLVRVRNPLGIPPSPILAPDRDLTGQLRVDDPTISTPSGQGENTFKDRGALDRSDLDGPTALLILPLDNDALRQDIDPTLTVVHRPTGVFSRFEIQLNDGRGGTSPIDGIGVDPRSVLVNQPSPLPESITITRNGQFLQPGIDYVASYNQTSRIIRLTPLTGIWPPDSVYVITLNNRDRHVLVAPTGTAVRDGDQFDITDRTGVKVVFEYDSGYTIQIPKTLSVQVPAAGGGFGGITDGSTFSITRSGVVTTFEFDSNGTLLNPSNVRVPFTVSDTADQIAATIANVVRNAGLGLSPKTLGGGVVHIGGTPAYSLDVGTTRLVRDGSPDAVVDGETFTITRPGFPVLRFEFDLDPTGDVQPGNIRVPFKLSDTHDDIANTLVEVIRAAGLGLNPTSLGGGQVHVGGTDHVIDTSGSKLVTSGQPGVTPNLRLHVPIQGGGPGGINDGQTFFITDGSRTVVFEFDDNGTTVAGNTIISINPGGVPSTQDEVANLIVTALAGSGFGLNPVNLGNGIVSVGGQAKHRVDVTGTTMLLSGVPGGAVPVVFRPAPSFTGNDMALAILRAINNSSLVGVQAAVRGGNTLFVEGVDPAGANINGITSFFLVGIKDFALNNLQPNQNSQETRFLILLGDNRLDFGDAPNTSIAPVGQFRYPTTLADNGARHVIFANNPLYLGRRVDADADGQPAHPGTPAGNDAVGDDLGGNGLAVDLTNSPALSASAGSTPLRLFVPETFFIQVPDQGGSAISDGEIFSLGVGATTEVFELDSDGVLSNPAHIRIPFASGSTANDIAQAIIDAIPASLRGTNGFQPVNLGNGRVHLGSRAGHTMDTSLAPSLISGGVAGSVVDGNTFSITRGATVFTFEFDDNFQTTLGNRVIAIDPRLTHQQLAVRIRDQILAANVGVTPVLLGNGVIDLDGDDEDGVRFEGAFNAFLDTPIVVTASAAGLLDAWVDFNRDGDWDDPGEKIFNSVSLVPGENLLFTRTPSTAVPGFTFARFRFSSLGGLAPTGLAESGEVEDYMIEIRPGTPPVAVNDPPPPGLYTTNEDSILVVSTAPGILGNDSDPDGDPLTVFNPGVLTSAKGARVTLNADGTFTYDPTVASAVELQRLIVGGATDDTFTYRAFDGFLFSNLATVTVRVTGLNDPPTTRLVTVSLFEDDLPVTANFLGDDVDNDDSQSTLVYTIVPGSGPAEGSVTNNGNGTFTFDPLRNVAFQDLAVGQQRDVSFQYFATDRHGATSNTSQVRITVTGKNDNPVALDMLVRATEDGGPVTVPFAGDDVDSDDSQATLTYFIFGVPSEGTLVNNGNGTLTFDPGSGFQNLGAGETRDTIVFYTATDRHGANSNLGTITIRVTGVNDPPVATNDPTVQTGYSTNEDSVLNINNAANGVLVNDRDVDTNDVLTVQGAPVSTTSAQGASVTINANGTFSYDPRSAPNIQRLNLGQSLSDTFTYTVTDGKGGTAVGTVTISVSGRNDRPVANPVLIQAEEDGPPVVGSFAGDDIDDEDGPTTLVYAFVPATGPAEGTITNNGNGTFTFNPGSAFQNLRPGQTRDVTVQYTATDRRGAVSLPGTITIRVTGKNDPPVAVDDLNVINAANSSVTIPVLSNDTDPDGSPFDVSSVTIVTPPSRGTATVNPDGTITYQANAGFLGVDALTYRFRDLEGPASLDSNVATVRVTTTVFPVAGNLVLRTVEGVPVVADVVAASSDADGTINPASVKVVQAPANGTTTVDPTTGRITYTPNLGFVGNDFFLYTVKDNVGAESGAGRVDVIVDINATPYRNPRNNLDVNADGRVTAFDALLVIRFLQLHGSRPPFGPAPPFVDTVPIDNFINTLDALAVIQFLNRRSGGGEGEASLVVAPATVLPALDPSTFVVSTGSTASNTASGSEVLATDASVKSRRTSLLQTSDAQSTATATQQSSSLDLAELVEDDELWQSLAEDVSKQRKKNSNSEAELVDTALMGLLYGSDYFAS